MRYTPTQMPGNLANGLVQEEGIHNHAQEHRRQNGGLFI